MDLRVLVIDENDDIIAEEAIYQDGSDSEGADIIVQFIEDNFTLCNFARKVGVLRSREE
jgi:hypothetical protein